MSIHSIIEFGVNVEVSPSNVFRKLIECGWWVDLDGSAFLNIGDQDDWVSVKNVEYKYLSDWFLFADNSRKKCGCTFVHKKTEIGGIFLFDEDWKSFRWIVSVNRPIVDFCSRVTDYTACLELIWPVIDGLGVDIETLSCSQ